MGRPKKEWIYRRVSKSYAVMNILIQHIEDQRGHMKASEYVHRLLADDYNSKNPDKEPITYWKEGEKQ